MWKERLIDRFSDRWVSLKDMFQCGFGCERKERKERKAKESKEDFVQNRERDGERSCVRFNLPGFNPSLICKVLGVILESGNNAGKIIVEFPTRIQIRDNLLVLDVTIL